MLAALFAGFAVVGFVEFNVPEGAPNWAKVLYSLSTTVCISLMSISVILNQRVHHDLIDKFGIAHDDFSESLAATTCLLPKDSRDVLDNIRRKLGQPNNSEDVELNGENGVLAHLQDAWHAEVQKRQEGHYFLQSIDGQIITEEDKRLMSKADVDGNQVDLLSRIPAVNSQPLTP